MTASQSISVSITPRQSQATWPKVYASQYDNGIRTVTVTITDRGGSFAIPDGATVTVRGTKPDKTGYEYACTVTGTDTVDFTITDQMTVLSGQHAAEIRITDANGDIIGTGNFWVTVEASPLSTDTAISKTELPLIEKAAENSTTAQAAADTAKTAAETAQTAAESASKSAASAEENAGKVLGASTLVEALSAETQRAKKAEETNATAIDTETANRKAADESLQKALDAEITRAKAAEGGADLTAEATARQTADAELQRKLDTETNERKAADDTASQAIDALSTTLSKTIDDRIAEVIGGAPESFDTLKEISDWISNNETSAAAMSSKISDNASAISGEVTRATTAEQTLTDSLSAETTRAKKAEEAATKAVSDETLRAEAAEKANADAITTETTDRKAADKTITDSIDSEITRAKAAEAANADNITSEATRAIKAETANSDAISALQTKVNGLKLTADNVTYDGTASGIAGTTVQAAIDEVKASTGGSSGADTAVSMLRNKINRTYNIRKINNDFDFPLGSSYGINIVANMLYLELFATATKDISENEVTLCLISSDIFEQFSYGSGSVFNSGIAVIKHDGAIADIVGCSLDTAGSDSFYVRLYAIGRHMDKVTITTGDTVSLWTCIAMRIAES